MKKLCFLFSLMLLAASACSKYETYEGDPLKTQIYTLDNGLKVFMTVNKEEPRMQTAICVKVGGKNDPKDNTGLSHYLEHLMFKGTRQFGTTNYELEKPLLDSIAGLFEVYRGTRDEAARKALYHRIDSISYEASKISIPNEYDKLMAAIGATGTNAFTSEDMTCYIEDIPANQIENWARIQADRFENMVIRGFHTELEAVYEEKNIGMTQDGRKVYEALNQALFPHHPYGTQTVIGTQEHLKNPSIEAVQKHFDTYYVPNNMAICVSGDFDPDEFVKIVKKYFGHMKPNNNLPKLAYEPEPEITVPVEKEVFGQEAEYMCMAWRLPGVASTMEVDPVAEIACTVMSNGAAGLMDLDLNKQHKILSGGMSYESQPDYSTVMVEAMPNSGQSLEEVRDLILAEVAKLCNGEFTEDDVTACKNNYRLNQMNELTSNYSRAISLASAFAYGMPWKDVVANEQALKNVTKEDIVDFANTYLCQNNYAIVYKREGTDPDIQKVEAPAITPIFMNRDTSSQFLKDISANVPAPIEPVFVDFSKDLDVDNVAANVDLLYVQNNLNDIFTVQFVFNNGTYDNPVLEYAGDYLRHLGTDSMTAEEFSRKMYSLACFYTLMARENTFTLSIIGLRENMGEAISLVENLIANAQPDEKVLMDVKSEMLQWRLNAKKDQGANDSAFYDYLVLGPETIAKMNLDNSELMAMTSEDILGSLRSLFAKQHEIYYYGPDSEEDVKACLAANHTISVNPEPLAKHFVPACSTAENKVFVAQYEAPNLNYYQVSVDDRSFDVASESARALFREYFSGGMNSVVFQEIRESRALAYSAGAGISTPAYSEGKYRFTAAMVTQSDKLQTAVEAYDGIINNMPVSENSLGIAKDAIISRMRTERTTGMGIIRSYIRCRDLGLDEPLDKMIYEQVPTLTMDDVVAYQQKWIKGRTYHYGILGNEKDIDMEYLKTLGPVQKVTSEEIFGF